jgi:hypothetical protein
MKERNLSASPPAEAWTPPRIMGVDPRLPTIDAISDEMRAVVKSAWPKL